MSILAPTHINLITIPILAPMSDYSGVQGAKQPLAYKVERSATVPNCKVRYYMQAPLLRGVALDSVSR